MPKLPTVPRQGDIIVLVRMLVTSFQCFTLLIKFIKPNTRNDVNSCDVIFYCQKMKGGKHMTDVHCDRKQCLNNCKGWCKAKAIHIDSACRSYAYPSSVMNGRHQRTVRTNGRKIAADKHVLK